MDPLRFAKAVYETFGAPHPRASLLVVMSLCAGAGAAVWLFLAAQVARDHVTPTNAPSASGPASTSGENSPANTGNQNQFNYDQSSSGRNK